MPDYTEDELIAKIHAIDTEVERLLLSTASGGPAGRTPLKYVIGTRSLDLTSRVEMLLKLRATYADWLAMGAGGVKEVATCPDYDVTDQGQQLGQRPDRPLGSEGFYDPD